MSGDAITFVGHATVLIEIGGARLLTDPFLGARLLHIRRHSAQPPDEIGRDLDAVLISHLHHDHLDYASLRRIGAGVPILVPRGGARALRRRGFVAARELEPGGVARLGGVDVVATPAEHEGRRYPFGPVVEALGFELRGAERRIYFAGDTDLFEGMEALAGDLDVALLPVGGWGPRLGAGHLDPRSAARAAALLRPRVAIPIHWGTLLRVGLGRRRDEILHAPARRFAAAVAEVAPAVEVRVLEPGDRLDLDGP